jgi:hypothetical protein
MRCLKVQEKIWIAPKGKPLELMIHTCHLFQMPTESQRLLDRRTRRRLRTCKCKGTWVDLMTVNRSDVVGSVSGK